MEINNFNEWEEKDELLVSKIKEFCEQYKKEHIKEFNKNEYFAHQKMLVISGRKFKKEIETQTFELVKLRQNSLFS